MSGYKPDFLGNITLPLPNFSIELSAESHEHGAVFDYPTYSVMMNNSKDKRSPIIVCLNIDQNLMKRTKRSDNWRIDPRIGGDTQLDNAYYVNNPWDRGHMARRESAGWGNTIQQAQRASDDTFFFSNSCLQHENLNQDEWLALEDWVKDLALTENGKITCFTGPIYGDNDRTIKPTGRELARIPAGFFNITCFINKNTNKLEVRAFIMLQDSISLKDKKGKKLFNNQNYQVTITEIERLTGLQFDDQIYEANPLFFSDVSGAAANVNAINLPERIEVASPIDIIAMNQRRQTVNDDIVDVFISAALIDNNNPNSTWCSIINLGNTPISVLDWELKDRENHSLTLTANAISPLANVLQPGQAIVLSNLSALQLPAEGGVLKLFDDQGNRIDWVTYGKHMVKAAKPVLFLQPLDI